ncbi:MAG: glutamine-hydrolyzing carbamoyl-phosphate synthase small subunit [Candidatus Micrarchaeia archaeon]
MDVELKKWAPISPVLLSLSGKKAYLYLEDGTVFEGFQFGAEATKYGEVVFTTSMNGYPESLTDPSYKGQILTIAHPLVGNYGVPRKEYSKGVVANFESEHIMVEGLVISELTRGFKWNKNLDLDEWLSSEGIAGVYGIDTRMLIKKIREKGAMSGIISTEKFDSVRFNLYESRDFVEEVSIKKPIAYGEGKDIIVVIDLGIKESIIQNLLKRGFKVQLLPWDSSIEQIVEYDPKGVVFSNGPGNPLLLTQIADTLKEIADYDIPILGICLGHQLAALAFGGTVKKMKYGHRAINKSVIDLETQQSYITTHNHGYAVYEEGLPDEARVWFMSNDDGVVEGMKIGDNIITVQFHPEARPGTNDTLFIFDYFAKRIRYG